MNTDKWCTITVGSMAPVTTPEEHLCVAAGTLDLTAVAASSMFEVVATTWTDTTTASAGTATETITGTGKACVWACCPFSSDGSGCSISDPCK
jgi:hypothetical protein